MGAAGATAAPGDVSEIGLVSVQPHGMLRWPGHQPLGDGGISNTIAKVTTAVPSPRTCCLCRANVSDPGELPPAPTATWFTLRAGGKIGRMTTAEPCVVDRSPR